MANEAGIVTAFPNRPGTPGTLGTLGTVGTGFHFVGVQAVNAAVFAGVSPETKSETVHGIYPQLISARPEAVRVFRAGDEFFDIGSPRDYLDTAMTLARREGRPLDRGRDCRIGDGAVLTDTILWDRVTIGEGARLESCVVADDVIVPAGAKFSQSSLVMLDNALMVQPFKGSSSSIVR